MTFKEKVFENVKKIPKGKVATYKQIAIMSGSANACRAVGNILHENPTPYIVPCHRIVNSKGCLTKNFAFGGIEEQAILLINENVGIEVDRVKDLKKYIYDLDGQFN